MPKRINSRKRKAQTPALRDRGREDLGIQRNPIFSARQQCVVRYCDYIAIDPALGVTADYVFGANCLYDPNITGSGHQPMGFDQWMTFYDHYHVVSSKIKATFVPPTTSTGDAAVWVGVGLRDTSGSLSALDVTNLLEQGTLGNHHYRQLPLVYDRGTVIVSEYDAGRFHGVSDLLASSILRGDASNNPSEAAYFHVWGGPVSGGVNSSAIITLVEIEFTVIFSEPKMLSQS